MRCAPAPLAGSSRCRWQLHGQGGCWLFGFQEYAELEALMAGLRACGIKVLEMQLIEPDLEDVYFHRLAEVSGGRVPVEA